MHFIEKTEDAVWRAIEWAFVLGMLSWIFVRLWSETLYDPHRARAAQRRWRHFWSRLPSSDGDERQPPGAADQPGPGGTA
jgi:hypothetical protein